jgi:hypothetical protein
MSVLSMPLSIIPLAITPAGVVLIGVVPIGAVPVVPIGPVLFPLDGRGFGALGSGFNI